MKSSSPVTFHIKWTHVQSLLVPSSGFSSLLDHKSIQLNQSHSSAEMRGHHTLLIPHSLSPMVAGFSLCSQVQLPWDFALYTVSSSPGCECTWLVNCCWSHLSSLSVMCSAIPVTPGQHPSLTNRVNRRQLKQREMGIHSSCIHSF